MYYNADMIELIINADDLGSGPERDRGILEAFASGIVTSASLLANGPSFSSAVPLCVRTGLPVGVHLNLADGLALSGPIAGLTDDNGRLPGKARLRQCLANGTCDRSALRQELSLQIERVFAAGLQPDHLDSHQHCQLFPCLNTLILELAQHYGIGALRRPLPAEPVDEDPGGNLGEEMKLYRSLAAIQATGEETSSVRFRPDGLWGMPLLDRLDTASLCHLLEEIPDGRWELMTHPGYAASQEDEFGGPRREIELRALCSPQARAIIHRRSIRLCSFGELACAS